MPVFEQVNYRLPPELKQKIEHAAWQDNVSMNQKVIEIFLAWFAAQTQADQMGMTSGRQRPEATEPAHAER